MTTTMPLIIDSVPDRQRLANRIFNLALAVNVALPPGAMWTTTRRCAPVLGATHVDPARTHEPFPSSGSSRAAPDCAASGPLVGDL